VAERAGCAVAVKICGVTRPADARLAALAGADYVGAILSPGFARSVAPADAATFLDVPGPVLVGVVVDAGVEAAARAARTAGAGVIQLHGHEAAEELQALRGEGDWRLWKAVRAQSADDVREAFDRWAGVADGLLLDGFHPSAAGGAGVAFPWEALEPLRGFLPEGLSLIVAGGLTPQNVSDAVSRLSPHVVDVSSGVEHRLGVKDPDKVHGFIDNARNAAGHQASAASPRFRRT